MKKLIVLIVLASVSLINACPVTIINDQHHDIMVIDPHTEKEIHIKGKSWLGVESEGTIKPEQSTITKWFADKKLVIKVKHNDNAYYPAYQINQRKCSTTGEIMLKMSNIKEIVKKPTDLLEAKEISANDTKAASKKAAPAKTKKQKKSMYQRWFGKKQQTEQDYFVQEQQDPENWE